jgi:hypothetical protein
VCHLIDVNIYITVSTLQPMYQVPTAYLWSCMGTAPLVHLCTGQGCFLPGRGEQSPRDVQSLKCLISEKCSCLFTVAPGCNILITLYTSLETAWCVGGLQGTQEVLICRGKERRDSWRGSRACRDPEEGVGRYLVGVLITGDVHQCGSSDMVSMRYWGCKHGYWIQEACGGN